MTVQASPLQKYITAEGRLTTEGLKFFALLIARIDALEARIEALEP